MIVTIYIHLQNLKCKSWTYLVSIRGRVIRANGLSRLMRRVVRNISLGFLAKSLPCFVLVSMLNLKFVHALTIVPKKLSEYDMEAMTRI